MIPNPKYNDRRNEIIRTIFVIVLSLSSITLKAQVPANFSGSWEYDKARSDKDETGYASFDGTIHLEISQNPDTISFSHTYYVKGKEGMKLPSVSFPTNGNVMTDNSGTDPAKKFVKWSQDKKVLVTNQVMTATIDGVAQDFITQLTFRLSDDGKTLTMEELTKSKLNGERTVRSVFIKK